MGEDRYTVTLTPKEFHALYEWASGEAQLTPTEMEAIRVAVRRADDDHVCEHEVVTHVYRWYEVSGKLRDLSQFEHDVDKLAETLNLRVLGDYEEAYP